MTDFIPRSDWYYPVWVSGEDDPSFDLFTLDGERLIGTRNGEVYSTWFINAQGFWQYDSHSTTLLRFLPPVIDGDQAWKQQSGDESVWFRLRRNNCFNGYGGVEIIQIYRTERTRYCFDLEKGIARFMHQDLANPVDSAGMNSFVTYHHRPPEPPERAAVLAAGAVRGPGPLPTVTDVTVAAFNAIERNLLVQYGAFTVIDLDGDGKLERIEGVLGHESIGWITIYDSAGRKIYSPYVPRFRRYDLAYMPALQRHVLLNRSPLGEDWRSMELQVVDNGEVLTVEGWHPTHPYPEFSVYGDDLWIEQDSSIVVKGRPELIAGYDWFRRYRLDETQYRVTLVENHVTAGSYPNEPKDLLTAVFIARSWGLTADLARYIPNPEARVRILALPLAPPDRYPVAAQLGALRFEEHEYVGTIVPKITPAPPNADGDTEYVITQDRGGRRFYYHGKVRFGTGEDGRLIIAAMEVQEFLLR